MNLRTDRFFDVPRTTRDTSEGPVEIPIRYYDVSNIVAMFDADLEGARAILEGTELEPAITSRDRALVGLSFYEYRDTSVGDYNEVGTAIFVVRRGDKKPRFGMADLLRSPRRRRVGAYVVDLPVTTAAANAAGRELWGYPKFITEIPFEWNGRIVRSAVADPDGAAPLCELTGIMGPGLPAPPLSLMTYTYLDDALIRTHVDVRGRVQLHAPGSVELRVNASEHRMARNLRTLGLDRARPRAIMATDRFQSLLHEGSRV